MTFTRAIAYRKGLIRARALLRSRRDAFREAARLVDGVGGEANSRYRLSLLADEADRCADRIDNELDRLPKIRGKKWGS